MRLRPARTQTFQFQTQHDLTLSILNAITTPSEPLVLDQIATFLFQTVNQPCLKIGNDDLRDSSEAVAIAVHKITRVATPC